MSVYSFDAWIELRTRRHQSSGTSFPSFRRPDEVGRSFLPHTFLCQKNHTHAHTPTQTYTYTPTHIHTHAHTPTHTQRAPTRSECRIKGLLFGGKQINSDDFPTVRRVRIIVS